MILKSLLALAGIGLIDHRQNALVHDLANKEMAVYAAHDLLAKRSIKVAEVIVNEPENRQKIARGVDDMFNVLMEVVNADRLSDRIRATAESAIARLGASKEGKACED